MLKAFVKDTQGNMAVIFAVIMLTLIAAVGAAVDFTSINAKRTSYQSMADAAVLAAARSGETTKPKLKLVADDVMAANNALGETLDVQLNVTDNGRVRVQVTGEHDMVFMGMFGKDKAPIQVLAEAPLSSSEPVNIAMVLDITGSMNGAKIASMRSSASGLVTYLEGFGSDTAKISVVPFARHVKISKSYRSQPWLDVPADSTSAPYKSCYWKRDNIPGTCKKVPSTCDNDGVKYACMKTVCKKGPKYEVCHMRTDKYTWNGCVGSRTFPHNEKADYSSKKIPGLMNWNCKGELLPLTKNLKTVKAKIGSLKSGDKTYLPGGLVWGWRTLSPKAPLVEAAASKGKSKNVMIVMTDGKNTLTAKSDGTHRNGDTTQSDKTAKNLCKNIKNDKIEVFTIAYDMSDKTAKNLLKSCATDATMFYDAANAADLDKAFQDIGARLIKLRLTH